MKFAGAQYKSSAASAAGYAGALPINRFRKSDVAFVQK